MNLRVVGTGSAGNTYLLTCGAETLVIDCGVRFLTVKKALNFNIRGIVGAIITHSHGDHAKYVKEYVKSGIDVWQPYLDSTPIQKKKVGDFSITTFPCIHDVPCVGYLIEHPESGLKLLYATDTEYVKYTFKGLTAMLLEANYGEEYVNRDEAKYRHVLSGHMSIETAIECVKANMNDGMKNLILCHLSADNSDPAAFQRAAREAVPDGVSVNIATPGLTVEL